MVKILVNGVEIETDKNNPANILDRVMSLEKFQEEILKLGDMIMESKKKESVFQENI